MGAGRFRAAVARMDALLVKQLGDSALLVGTDRVLLGAFKTPYQGPDIGQRQGGVRLGQVVDASGYSEPTFTLPAASALGIAAGAQLDIDLPVSLGGGRYEVARVKPDGLGMVDLVLRAGRNDRASNPA